MLTSEKHLIREPFRDWNILSIAHKKLQGESQPFLSKPDTTFIRAFSWFPNSSIPSTFSPLLNFYIRWTHSFLADPRDTIFVTHIIFSLLTIVPSALLLLYRFNWIHAILHTIALVGTIPPYILMLHCACHKKVTKSGRTPWTDYAIHYLLGPFYGETWNTFYYHHVKHHHVEDNGVDDLSSTIWFDRDNIFHFAQYFGRFYFLIGIELPLYFIRKGKRDWALNVFVGEYGTLLFLASFFLICSDPKSVIFSWFVPLNLARIGMMSGNWTQHAFLAQDDAKNDYKTALTVIQTPYNATAFNDGYHTSHHLNPIRHWQDHPEHFVENIKKFRDEKVIIFDGVDYWGLFCLLMTQNYLVLADRFVDLTGTMSQADKIAYLKERSRRLSEKEIALNYDFGSLLKNNMTDAISAMFHEKQEGQLCAQHALNNLLQGEFFSPIDLAQIARDLDHAELEALLAGATNQEQEDIEKTFQENRESHNYDDSGFFSVQVITKALQVWNLNIIPIGSSDPIAKKAMDTPEEEFAFILNLAEHWFTLRKFGGSKDRWYNLNSVNSEPQHVSKTYLRMLLQQMKAEGYSIFVVVGKLSESEADQYCQLVPIPPTEALVKNSKAIKNAQKNIHNDDDDLQKALRMSLGQDQQSDEAYDRNDDDLNAAIKASMMDPGMDQESLALAISASLQAPSSSNDTESNHVEKRPADENSGKLSLEEIRRRRLERFG